MIALDTNVIIRLFVDNEDSREQAELVKTFLKNHDCTYMSQIVQIELVWVLESCYGFDKNTIINVLQLLFDRDDFYLENPEQFYQALMLFKTETADFSDYLIFANSQQKQLPFYTFDKKLSRAEGVIKLTDNVIS